MKTIARRWSCGLALALALDAAAAAQTPASDPAGAFPAFDQALKEYVALHEKLERTLPELPKEATPQQIDTHQRALTQLLQQARRGAKPGDVFAPVTRAAFRRILAEVFAGPNGRELFASTMDDNPVTLKVKVNDRYPDAIPLATVPPQVLQRLPRLPGEVEFRFIGRDLILLDVHAHMIVDIIDKAIPL